MISTRIPGIGNFQSDKLQKVSQRTGSGAAHGEERLPVEVRLAHQSQSCVTEVCQVIYRYVDLWAKGRGSETTFWKDEYWNTNSKLTLASHARSCRSSWLPHLALRSCCVLCRQHQKHPPQLLHTFRNSAWNTTTLRRRVPRGQKSGGAERITGGTRILEIEVQRVLNQLLRIELGSQSVKSTFTAPSTKYRIYVELLFVENLFCYLPTINVICSPHLPILKGICSDTHTDARNQHKKRRRTVALHSHSVWLHLVGPTWQAIY